MAKQKPDEELQTEAAEIREAEEILQLQDQADLLKGRNEELAAENAGLKKQVDELKKAAEKTPPRIDVKGFLLEPGDPFAAGAMRHYLKILEAEGRKTNQPVYLPFVLPWNDTAGLKAINNYIIRALAAGDRNRVETARGHQKKFAGYEEPKKKEAVKK